MHPLSNYTDLILIMFIIAGIGGTFIPVLPGPTLIVIGALLHGFLNDFQPLGWFPLLILGVACIAAALGQTMLTSFGTHKFGGSKAGMIGGTVGLLAGFFIPFPGGMIIGAFIGAVGCELYFAGKEIKQATKAGFGGLVGLFASFLFEILITLGMVIYILILF